MYIVRNLIYHSFVYTIVNDVDYSIIGDIDGDIIGYSTIHLLGNIVAYIMRYVALRVFIEFFLASCILGYMYTFVYVVRNNVSYTVAIIISFICQIY